jgi:hypothetical protein
MTTVRWTPPAIPEIDPLAKYLAKSRHTLETGGTWEDLCKDDPIRAQLKILMADAETRFMDQSSYEAHTAGLEGNALWIFGDIRKALEARYPELNEAAA